MTKALADRKKLWRSPTTSAGVGPMRASQPPKQFRALFVNDLRPVSVGGHNSGRVAKHEIQATQPGGVGWERQGPDT